MKKIVSLAIIMALLFGVFSLSVAAQGSSVLLTETFASSGEQKIFCDATIEDDFADNRVMVVLSNQRSLEFDSLAIEDFAQINCISVRDMSLSSTQKVKERVQTVKSSITSMSTAANVADLSIIEEYNQVLCLELGTHSKEDVLSAIDKLQENNDVIYAGPDYKLSICSTTTNDTEYNEQWAIPAINLPEAWDITTGSNAVKVGIIDTGINPDHPDLIDNLDVALSVDFLADEPTPGESLDPNGHGTMVASIVGAIGNNNVGISGVCWDVTLVSLRAFDWEGDGYSSDVASAIQYAEEAEIPILNLSSGWSAGGWDYYDYALASVIENYSGLVVCAAGNDGWNNDEVLTYPANYSLPNLITVGASDSNNDLWEFSNYGHTTVDIFAPGEQIICCYPAYKCEGMLHDYDTHYGTEDEYGYHIESGTSFAAPYVTGVAALILSKYPSMTATQIKLAIIENADDIYDEEGNSIFEEKCVSGGIVNAYKALLHVYTYTATDASTHLCICEDCGYSYSQEHFWKYTATESLLAHAVECRSCGYVSTQAHMWIDKGDYYWCSICRKTSTSIPVNFQSNFTNLLNGNQAVAINDNTVLCCIDDQYYLVKASTVDEALMHIIKNGEVSSV